MDKAVIAIGLNVAGPTTLGGNRRQRILWSSVVLFVWASVVLRRSDVVRRKEDIESCIIACWFVV